MKGKLLKHFSFFTSCNFQITTCANFHIYKPHSADAVKKASQLHCTGTSVCDKAWKEHIWPISGGAAAPCPLLQKSGNSQKSMCALCALQRAGGKRWIKHKHTETSWLERRWTLHICPYTSGKAATPRSDYNFNHVPGLLETASSGFLSTAEQMYEPSGTHAPYTTALCSKQSFQRFSSPSSFLFFGFEGFLFVCLGFHLFGFFFLMG